MPNRICCIAIFLTLAGTALADVPDSRAPGAGTCESLTTRQERRDGIPAGLLTAIALAETGRWDETNRESFAWPWTVTSGGKGRYFGSKAEAVAEVERLKAAGARNIDVGCMQVNLLYHGEAFDSLDEALDPATNITYAAGFLKRLRDDTETWNEAAAHYHSQTPDLAARYRARVEKLWARLRGGALPAGPAVAAVPADIAGLPDVSGILVPPAPVAPVARGRAIDWERTAALNARLFHARNREREEDVATRRARQVLAWKDGQPAPVHAAPATRTGLSGAGTPPTRAVRTEAQSAAFAASRRRDLADWRARARKAE